MSENIRIIIADDHPLLRQGLRHVIEREVNFEVVAEAGDGAAALDLIVRWQPDVVVLDLDMPEMNGFDVLREVRGRGFDTKIILLTVHNEEEFFSEALRIGANAYILKDSAIESIVAAIRAILTGEIFINCELNRHSFRRRNGGRPKLPDLTVAEKQILKHIADYKTNREIGELLFISPLTVKTHRRNISRKLELEGTTALMRFALENKNLL